MLSKWWRQEGWKRYAVKRPVYWPKYSEFGVPVQVGYIIATHWILWK